MGDSHHLGNWSDSRFGVSIVSFLSKIFMLPVVSMLHLVSNLGSIVLLLPVSRLSECNTAQSPAVFLLVLLGPRHGRWEPWEALK